MSEKVHFAFYSDFSIDPKGPHLVPYMYTEIDEYFLLDDYDISSQWYQPGSQDPGPPLGIPCNDGAHQATPHIDFELGMNLVYRDGHGKNVPVVYEGASIDGLTHTIRLVDSSNTAVHNSNLKVLDHPYFSNVPKTPLNSHVDRQGIRKKQSSPPFLTLWFKSEGENYPPPF